MGIKIIECAYTIISFWILDIIIRRNSEMEDIDGGIGAPNWLVGGAINVAITAITGGSAAAASGFFRGLARKYGEKAAAVIFLNELKKQLMRKGVASWIASGICSGASAGFTILEWTGNQLAKYLDANDCRPNNGWVDIA